MPSSIFDSFFSSFSKSSSSSSSLPLPPFLFGFLLFAWSIYFLETWLDVRQHRKYQIQHKPKQLTYFTQEEFKKAQEYGYDKSSFGFLTSLKSNIKLTLYLLFGYYPFVWSLSGDVLTQWFGMDASRVMIQTAIFYCIDAAGDTLLSIPFSAYSTFVIEEKHGFNKQTVGLFVSDIIKGFLLNCIIAPPIMMLLIWVIEVGGENFYLYCTGLLLIIQLIAVPFYSNFIQPCFNKVEPLPEGSLRTSIEKLAESIKFPLTQLYVIDGSKRSSHSNAYFYGFFKSKRIVLFDTLIAQCSESEVLSVLAHELGHWSLSHTIKNLLLGQVQMLVMFYLFGCMIHNPSMYNDFGFTDSRPTYIGLLLFSFIYSPVQHVTAFVMNMISRKFEFEADAFGVKLGYGEDLAKSLIILQKENKGTPISDTLYSAYHHSHPPLLQRLEAIEKEIKNKGKKTE